MKEYNVTLTVEFEKKIKIKADDGETAMDKATDILLNTNLINSDNVSLTSVYCEAEGISKKQLYEEETDDDYSVREILYDETY